MEEWLAEGRKVPAGYLDRPHLRECLEGAWDAFWSLTSDRQIGFSEGPIPFSSIDRYAVRYGIDDLESFDLFRTQIQMLDSEYLKYRSEQRERDQAKPEMKPV